MLVSIVYVRPRSAWNEKTSTSLDVSMTPFTLEPTEILVADERLSPWSSDRDCADASGADAAFHRIMTASAAASASAAGASR